MSSKNGIFCFLIFFLVSEKKDLTWIKNHKKVRFSDFRCFELKFSTVGPYYVYNKVLTPFFYFSRSYGLGLVHSARFFKFKLSSWNLVHLFLITYVFGISSIFEITWPRLIHFPGGDSLVVASLRRRALFLLYHYQNSSSHLSGVGFFSCKL